MQASSDLAALGLEAADLEMRAREEEKAKQKAEEEFRASPQGRARAAHEAGQKVFQITLPRCSGSRA